MAPDFQLLGWIGASLATVAQHECSPTSPAVFSLDGIPVAMTSEIDRSERKLAFNYYEFVAFPFVVVRTGCVQVLL